MKHVSFVIMLLVVAGLAVFAETTIPQPQFLAEGLRNQIQLGGGSLTIEYKVERQKEGGEVVPMKNVRYIRTLDSIYMEETRHGSSDMEVISFNKADKETRSISKQISDGQITGASISKGYVDPRLTVLNMMETADLCVTASSLYEAVVKGSVVGQESIDEHNCWRVDVSGESVGWPSSAQFSIWLDPSIGFCPRRIDLTGSVPSIFSLSFQDYKDIGSGVWFPSRQVYTHGKDNSKTILTLISASLDKPQGASTIVFPSGTRVYDRQSGKWSVAQ